MFTGKLQRDGVASSPFIVAGLFDLDTTSDQIDADGVEALASMRSGWRVQQSNAKDVAAADQMDGGDVADAEKAAADVGNRISYHWGAYRAVWKYAPMAPQSLSCSRSTLLCTTA